jgi:hypothetical protein
MNASDIQVTNNSPPPSAQATPQSDQGFHFHDLLSMLNPLQYLPIIGTIYRAITGDVIPDAVRYSGSMAVSGLLGGPIGLVTNIALLVAEKATGIDPEQIVAGLFHKAPPALAAPTIQDAPSSGATRLAWTPQQLAAYGVSVDASGTMHRGAVQGADVLNEIEQARIGRANSAYAAVVAAVGA